MIWSGLMFIARTILDRAEEELNDVDAVYREMGESHALLESGAISAEEFERREQCLIQRLEAIEARRHGGSQGEDGEDEDEPGAGGDHED